MLLFAVPAWAGSRDEQWKKVDEAIGKGLPKTAIENLEPIIAGAMQDKAYAEAIKAIAKKIALEGNIQGNKPEEKIVRMKAEIAKAPEEMEPVMEAILANWYWHYFQQNRWRFMQRTATAQSPGDDFTTWDLPRILAEIDKQFTKALAGEAVLKATPVAGLRRPAAEGHRAGQLPADAVRFPGLQRAGVLQRRRTGRGQGRGCLRPDGRQPDLRAGRGVRRLGGPDRATRTSATLKADPAVPESAEVPSAGRGPDGLDRRRPAGG